MQKEGEVTKMGGIRNFWKGKIAERKQIKKFIYITNNKQYQHFSNFKKVILH